jgi:hypothetical protein
MSDRKDDAERQFRWRVDIPVPGVGVQRFPAMLDWCEHHLQRSDWDVHGHNTGQKPYIARFYFIAEQDASAFRDEWSPKPSTEAPGAAGPNQGQTPMN